MMVPVVPMLETKCVIVPDFRPGAPVMRQRIIGIGELIQHPTLALGLHAQRQITRMLHAALQCRREDELCTIGRHAGAALLRQVVRHDENHAVALHRCHHGQGDAGVAAGGFDQGVARMYLATRLGTRDHRQGRTVLDRTGRIIALELDQDAVIACRVVSTRNTLQLHQRRIADGRVQGQGRNRRSQR
jgi:hypothetical protein